MNLRLRCGGGRRGPHSPCEQAWRALPVLPVLPVFICLQAALSPVTGQKRTSSSSSFVRVQGFAHSSHLRILISHLSRDQELFRRTARQACMEPFQQFKTGIGGIQHNILE